jgi:hypothetical protein
MPNITELIFFLGIVGYIAYDDAFKNIGKVKEKVVFLSLLTLVILSIYFNGIPKPTILDIIGGFLLLYYVIYGTISFNTSPYWKTYTLITTLLMSIIGLTHHTLFYYAIFYGLGTLAFSFGDVTENTSLKGWGIFLTLIPIELMVLILAYTGHISMYFLILLQILIPYTLFLGGFIGGGDILLYHLISLYYPIIGFIVYIISFPISGILHTIMPKWIPKIVHYKNTGKSIVIKNTSDAEILKEYLPEKDYDAELKTNKTLTSSLILLLESGLISTSPLALPLLIDIHRRIKKIGLNTEFSRILYPLGIIGSIAAILSLWGITIPFTHEQTILLSTIFSIIIVYWLVGRRIALLIGSLSVFYYILSTANLIPAQLPKSLYTTLVYPFTTSLAIMSLGLFVGIKIKALNKPITIAVPHCINIFISLLLCLIIYYSGGINEINTYLNLH